MIQKQAFPYRSEKMDAWSQKHNKVLELLYKVTGIKNQKPYYDPAQ